MPKIYIVDYSSIRAEVTMEQVLRHYKLIPSFTANKSDTKKLSGPCPIHSRKDPKQFKVNLTKDCWYCFSDCKFGGGVLEFVARMENTTIHEAAVKLCKWFKLTKSTKPSRKLNLCAPRSCEGSH